MSVEAVAFDLGNVLVEVDYSRAVERLRKRCSAPYEELLRVISDSSHQRDFETGSMTGAQFFSAVGGPLEFDGGYDEFCSIFCEIFSPVDEMVRIHQAIRRKGVATYIFSNTSALHFEYIRRTYPFIAEFDGYFLSYELKAMKPEPFAYSAVEQGTRCAPGRLAYMDDRPENVASAEARGWRAIHHVSAENTRAALERPGIL